MSIQFRAGNAIPSQPSLIRPNEKGVNMASVTLFSLFGWSIVEKFCYYSAKIAETEDL